MTSDKQLRKVKKPKFKRHDSHKKVSVKEAWRRPKGLQNKVRLGLRGYRRKPATGFGSPASLKGKTSEGMSIAVVCRLQDLDGLKPKDHVILIDSRVGAKRRLEILEYLKKKDFRLLRMDVDSELLKITKDLERRKKQAEEKKKEKKERKETKSIGEKVKKEAPELSDDEKKKQEKAEKDKLLTRKE